MRLPTVPAPAVVEAATPNLRAVPPGGAGASSTPSHPDDPFARAAAGQPERTIPDLALEDPERAAQPIRPAPEPFVSSRDPGLLDFGEVNLGAPDPFGDPRPRAYGVGSEEGRASGADDPLADLSLADLGASPSATPAPSAFLPPPVEAPPLAAPAPAVVEPPAPPPSQAPRGAVPEPEGDMAAEAERSRRRLRAVGVNALSLIALIALAVVLFQVWRGRQQNATKAPSGPAAAVDVSSRPYETASGKSVVVVRGRVQAAQPLARAEVRVELLDGGRPVATGRALAGAIPTAEEVHAVASAADAEQLADAIASRAPSAIAAGEVLPFTAVVADPPAGLDALEVRVSLRVEPAKAP